MRQDYSRTAEGMAVLRALEQHQPAARRILNDPYAKEFIFNPAFRFLALVPWHARGVSFALQFWAPGGQEFLTIRARLVDELAVEQVAQGINQIVLLGAGFDTLAWRQREALRQVTIYEVDHPATQRAKRRVSERIGQPGNLRFVAVDFERDDFVAKLREAGFDATRPAFIIWVGVSYYLTAKAVADTLQRIATISQPGTKLVWDYMLAEVVDGTSHNLEALDKARRAARLGEPWLFGLEPAKFGEYVAQFGLKLLHDYESAELRARYCPQRQMPMNYVRIAVCESA
ncbi:MAG: SAM-dependent methyltransferase [Acidobacteria bacterium]|nr:SAM-dependent methyltransferase [Acidobacteriota bacterium]MBI3427388.1 SAM-dependent methyltransferase [Acidobacteriota bacterium]